MTNQRTMTRRTFVKVAGAAAAMAGMTALAGCAGGSGAGGASSAASSAAGEAPTFDNTINPEVEELKAVLLGKDSKIAAIIVALNKGYYDEEKLTLSTQVVSGGFPEAMPALFNGSVDVLPFGSIPTCTYVGQGDDLVIFGGTVANGSECVTLIENKDRYTKPEDFRGKKIGCFRMETGHMVTKSWLRQNGIEDGKDVEFILLESSAAEVAAVENGEIDMCFVNSGYGYVATQGGKCAVAFRPNELIGKDFPCCRQSTNRTAFEEKRSALIKFEIANLRAMYDIANDHEGTIAIITAYSGQPEEYVENITYGKGDYVAAMTFEMDPYTDDVKAFYGDMVDNGDIEDANKDLIDAHLDSTIYKAALDALIERGENKEFYEGLLKVYEAHNTLGV
ncbi:MULTISPECIES: ABC transporter substrate-binding protein [unclassified Adlercreutzia]|uniref:ABC transporter substrate-binding protein n=1 Tax=unclassified Adlercreutzia TaxID=2636013 RepID=UPI0013EDD2EF|nr:MULTISPECIES: ABC transporter substrate-binding protein [unclassified Adlercreutzia]